MTLLKRVSTGVATAGIMLATLVSPVLAAEIDVTGNGVNSTNTVVVSNVCKSKLKQSNLTGALTEADLSSSTGNNQANANTGGPVTIDTGNADSTALVTVTGGDNVATMPDCCECSTSDPTVNVSGNGVNSTNTVVSTNEKKTKAKQRNATGAMTGVGARSRTGKNKANSNTGGAVNVKTGNADTLVDVTVEGGSNTLNP